jgi:hypothetical protein
MENNVTKESIETLLSQVSTITKKYDDIAKITGENFNVFSILGLSTNEVRAHSRMLAELLNPQGSHAMGDVFLKFFVKNLIPDNDLKEKYLTATSKANVVIEKWIGNVNDDNDTGGFIDILIEFPNSEAIIIENKIYAGDQRSQLRRYHNYNKKATLIYLTLDGKLAEDYTTQNKKYINDAINPICLSYRDNIKIWLELCKKEAVNHPLVRETITQYIYLIKRLTHQTMNEEMKKEVFELILNSSKYTKALFLLPNQEEVLQEIFKRLKAKIESSIVIKSLGLLVEFDKGFEFGKKDSSFWIFKSHWKYCISYVFWEDYENLYVTIDTVVSGAIKENFEMEIINTRLLDLGYGQIDYQTGCWNAKLDFWEKTKWEDVLNNTLEDIENNIELILARLEGVEL